MDKQKIDAEIRSFCHDDFGLSLYEEIRDNILEFETTDEDVAIAIRNLTDTVAKLIIFQKKPLDAVDWLRDYMKGSGKKNNEFLSVIIRILEYRIDEPTPNMNIILSKLRATDFQANTYPPFKCDNIAQHFLGTDGIGVETYMMAMGKTLGALKTPEEKARDFIDELDELDEHDREVVLIELKSRGVLTDGEVEKSKSDIDETIDQIARRRSRAKNGNDYKKIVEALTLYNETENPIQKEIAQEIGVSEQSLSEWKKELEEEVE